MRTERWVFAVAVVLSGAFAVCGASWAGTLYIKTSRLETSIPAIIDNSVYLSTNGNQITWRSQRVIQPILLTGPDGKMWYGVNTPTGFQYQQVVPGSFRLLPQTPATNPQITVTKTKTAPAATPTPAKTTGK